MEVFYINRPEITVSFFILLRLKYIEFCFPETKKGLVYTKHFSNFTHGIVLFLKQYFILRNLYKICFFRYLPYGLPSPA